MDEHIAWIDLALNRTTLTVLNLNLFFSWYDDIADEMLHFTLGNPVKQIAHDFVLVASISLDDVPPHVL
jgi:hypothetical protein